MKIGIVTIHKANNYGAVLQSTATSIFLKKYGVIYYINDDNCKYLQEQLNLIRFSFFIKGILRASKDILRLKNRYTLLKKFNTHFNYYYNELYINKDTNIINELDVIICGSDQIWNPQCTNGNDIINDFYFLNFANKKTKLFSYASSAGSYKYNSEQLSEIKNYLNRFSRIGVRELDLSNTLNNSLGLSSEVVLDPTLLINRSDWDLLPEEKINNIPNEYIFIYIINNNPNTNKIIREFKNKFNLPVISLTQEVSPNHKADIYIKNAGPLSLINLVKNSSFVITDSFHGCCISISYEKQFITINPGISKLNRINSLYKSLNISKFNIINDISDVKNIIKNDYLDINNNLSTLRSSSIALIEDVIKKRLD